ncbi:hypothetical protein CPB84DRAFT_196725 [Gymnopilus junonius]|uniref:Uncharacterized protein n=1 Tax=Gymnopilus junonius TaxID=109634 RepID=A0A9P5TJ96_GYMJU|nr:hypothetical protein CPB84DRAFT_196725 [Gymnopilus junonius]
MLLPIMMSRAGLLLTLIFTAFIGLVACAPVPERLSNLVERYDGPINNCITQSLGDPANFKREYITEFEGRELDLDFNQHFKREYDFQMSDKRDVDDIKYDFGKRKVELERRNVFKKIGHAFKHAFHAVKTGFQKAGHAIAHVAKKAATGVVHAAKKVGHFVKTTGAKVAKFGLKVVAAAASVASKVVKFIPGVGTAAGMALKGVAVGANKASDKIHANLGKLGKVDKGLNNVINPLGSAVKHMGKGGKVVGALL